MFNFIICEDDLHSGSIIKSIIAGYTSFKGIDCQTILFQNHFERIIDFAENNLEHHNVYFIDIILNQENTTGLLLAKQIRQIDVMAYLIFITSYLEFSLKIFQYKLRALDYIYKHEDNVQKRICDCIDTIILEVSQLQNADTSRQITLRSVNQIYTIQLQDIMYIETRPGSRLLYCVLKDGNIIEFHDTLKGVLKKLDSRFFQCHRSYIVNTRQIKKLGNEKQFYSVTMNDGKVCDVSKPNWKELISRVKT
jgi:two-component system response regulator AgrA